MRAKKLPFPSLIHIYLHLNFECEQWAYIRTYLGVFGHFICFRICITIFWTYRTLLNTIRWFLQVNLVDWLKMMVGNRRAEEVVDPNIETRPSTSALKRALLTALRCVDPDGEKRPKMSQVVRMLESEEYPIPREVRLLLLIY